MLKNKEQRKQFILDNNNWKLIHSLPDVATEISMVELPDGTIIYRFETRQENIPSNYNPGIHKVVKYRIKIDDHVSDEVSMTYIVDLLGKVK